MNAYPFRTSFLTLGAVPLSGIALANCASNNTGTQSNGPYPLDGGVACELIITPSSVSLDVGDTVTLTAADYYVAPSTSAVTVQWSAAGGHFDQASTSATILLRDGEPIFAAASTNTLLAEGPAGTYAFTVQATSSTGCVASASGTIVIGR